MQSPTSEMKLIHQTIDHHSGVLEMGQLCEVKAIHQELLHKCRENKQVQEQEINILKDWLQLWHGMQYRPHVHEKRQQQMKMLEPLEGEEFERAFLKALVHHHQEMISMIDSRCSPDFHSELTSMCQILKDRLTKDVQEMQQWLSSWYGEQASVA